VSRGEPLWDPPEWALQRIKLRPYQPVVPKWYPTGPVNSDLLGRAAARLLLAAHDLAAGEGYLGSPAAIGFSHARGLVLDTVRLAGQSRKWF